jgi:HEAT repeat protein
VTSLTRWKLACLLLAGLAGYSTFIADRSEPSSPPAVFTAKGRGALSPQLRRPLRISADAAGLSHAELVERALTTRSVRELQQLADKLGAIGTDRTVDQLAPLLSDTRRNVPETVLRIYGQIGTEHAVAALTSYTKDDRLSVRSAAITALGMTQSRRAEELLVALAESPTASARSDAVSVLARLASGQDPSIAPAAVHALGVAGTPSARVALRELLGAHDPEVVAAALSAIEQVDDAMLEQLTRMVTSGSPQLVDAAISALGKAGEVALPVLREAVFHGSRIARGAATSAIGEIGGSQATQLLGEILMTGDPYSATLAASALANRGGAEARDLLIEAALSDRARVTGALARLAELDGEDVEQALLAVLEDGTSRERLAALPRLLKSGNPKALQLALDFATRGTRGERYDAVRMLADAGTPSALEALMTVASSTRGEIRQLAITHLVRVRPADPAVTDLVIGALFSGVRTEVMTGATLLGRLGTEQARAALLTALASDDKALAAAAAEALRLGPLTDEVKSALLAASRGNPNVRFHAMQQLLEAGDPAGLTLAEEVLAKGYSPHLGSTLWSLKMQGTEQGRRLIERATESQDSQVRRMALSMLADESDERTTELVLRLTRDQDSTVRADALSVLGQVGSERARQVLIDVARSASKEDRLAAIQGLSMLDDQRASEQLVALMRDRDEEVAQQAIHASHNGGPEVDRALLQLFGDPSTSPNLKHAAAVQLRQRGVELDAGMERQVNTVLGLDREDDDGHDHGAHVAEHFHHD